MDVTVNSTTLPNYRSGGSTAELRIYITDSFFSSGIEYPAGFYKSVACTVAGEVVTIPSFTLPSTTDSTNDNARYVAVLHDSTGTKVVQLMGGIEFFVQPVSPVSWSDILIANKAVRRRMPDGYYTAPQIDSMLSGISLKIGNTVTSATQGSILFAGAGGTLSQDNTRFHFDISAGSLKLLDSTYVPSWGGPTTNYFSIGTNTRQVLPSGSHLLARFMKVPLTISGSNGTYVGSYDLIDVQGTVTNPTVVANLTTVTSNSLTPAGTGSLTGHKVTVDVGGNVSSAVGGQFAAQSGGSGANGTSSLTGVYGIATAAHNSSHASAVAGDFYLTTNGNGVVTTATAVRARANLQFSAIATNIRGLALADWTTSSGGSANNSYGIYADASIDIGTVSKYFIYSLSTSASLFSGEIRVPDEAYGVGWNTNLSVPTKNAVYDKIEELLAGGGVSIGGAVGNGPNALSVLFIGSTNLVAQNTAFRFNPTYGALALGAITPGQNGTRLWIGESSAVGYGSDRHGGIWSQITSNESGTNAWMIGILNEVEYVGTNVSEQTGLDTILTNTSTDATTGHMMVGMRSYVSKTAGGTNYLKSFEGAAGIFTSGTVTDLTGLEQTLNKGAACVVTNAYWLRLRAAITGTPVNSYGIYAEANVGAGSALGYFIYSLSSSPSFFSGEVRVPDETYGAGWDGDLSVPTKNAVYKGSEAELLALGFPLIRGIERIHVRHTGASGDNDVYTVPAGKKAIFPRVLFYNITGGSIARVFNSKIGGAYYRLLVSQNVTANSYLETFSSYVFNAGESLAVNLSAVGVIVSAVGWIVPDTAKVKTVRINNLSNVDTLFYEVPVGKVAYLIGTDSAIGTTDFSGSIRVRITNDSGEAPTITGYYVPAGGIVELNNQVAQLAAIGAQHALSGVPQTLQAGEKIYLRKSTATAGVHAWTTVIETDA